MTKSPFTGNQIMSILKQVESGTQAPEIILDVMIKKW